MLTQASIKSKLMQDSYHDFVNIVFPDYLFSYLDVFMHSTLISKVLISPKDSSTGDMTNLHMDLPQRKANQQQQPRSLQLLCSSIWPKN